MMLAARLGCIAWVVASISTFATIAMSASHPQAESLLVAIGCVALVLSLDRYRYAFEYRGARVHTSPTSGFIILLIVAVDPVFCIVAGSILALASARHLSSQYERIFHLATGLLTIGIPSLLVHEAFGSNITDKHVLGAVATAAFIRALLILIAEILAAEARSSHGAVNVLRKIPLGTILVLEAGLPTLAVAVAGPFLSTPPIALLIVLGGQLLIWRILVLQHSQFVGHHKTNQIFASFQRFVPQHVANSIVRSGSNLDTNGGVRRTITVMFLDVRGFTSWSERADPSEVFAEINLLLGELADAVLSTDGTIDKFTGDGLMAFWNAPLEQHDHAQRAVATIPRLMMRVRELNLRREARNSAPFRVGIGIATGAAMVGNIGHQSRLAFTAIGDTVNLAARLESSTADLDIPVLIDERTFLALPYEMQRKLMRLDSIQVKGRSERVRVYAPIVMATAKHQHKAS